MNTLKYIINIKYGFFIKDLINFLKNLSKLLLY